MLLWIWKSLMSTSSWSMALVSPIILSSFSKVQLGEVVSSLFLFVVFYESSIAWSCMCWWGYYGISPSFSFVSPWYSTSFNVWNFFVVKISFTDYTWGDFPPPFCYFLQGCILQNPIWLQVCWKAFVSWGGQSYSWWWHLW